MSNLSIGRIVRYRPTSKEQCACSENPYATAREELPAIIVSVNPDETVNLKVFQDSTTDLHVKNIKEGDDPGQYRVRGFTREQLIEANRQLKEQAVSKETLISAALENVGAGNLVLIPDPAVDEEYDLTLRATGNEDVPRTAIMLELGEPGAITTNNTTKASKKTSAKAE